MENIYRFKKRMVFPEKLILDQVDEGRSASTSWCNEPLENHSNVVNVKTFATKNHLEKARDEERRVHSASTESATETHHQFIQDRIRHLVDAFSTRAHAARQRLDGPETPSSLSSSGEMDNNSTHVESKPRLSVAVSDKYEQDDECELEFKITTAGCLGRCLNHIQIVDPNGKTYVFGCSCSSGEMDNNSTQVESKPRLSVAFSDKYEQDDEYEPEFKITTAGCLGRCLNHIQIVDPNGKTYVFWMFVVTLAVLYNAWVIPLRSTFPYQTAQNRAGWMTFDYIADIIYIIDVILIQPRVKYLHEGFWVTERNLLRQNFIKNKHFKLDVMSLIPLDLLYFITGPDLVILRFPRFFKMHTFWEFFSLVDRRLANPYTIRITKTFIYMMYLIHLNACAYYAFSIYEGIGSNSFVYNGQGNAYIKCFYFATKTATSIGKNPKPSQELEYIFMTFSWLMGVFVFALLIGQIRDIISTATRSKTEYRKLVDETLEYMRRMNLPQEMQRRVQLWFSYTWETQHTLDENNIMDCLPHKMKTDIAINVHIQTLSKVKLFADCDEALRRELVLELKSVIYLPGDIICKKGDIGTEMYIIQSGKVQVIGGKDGNEVLATLSEGSVFGEISLLGIPGMNRRTADVRSYGYSNLFVLDKTSLNQALSHYPEAQDLLNKKAKMLMKKNAALERKNNAMIVIKNPTSPEKHAKLLETVLQVLPPDSKSNRLLRYGSRQAPRRNPANDRFKYRNSLPAIQNYQGLDQEVIDNNNDPKQCDVTDSASSSSEYEEEAKITVHRTLS